MCGRYTLYGDDHLVERFNLATRPTFVSKDNYNVAPRQQLPIVYMDDAKNRVASLMQWGYLPSWAKDIQKERRPINTRSETVFSSPMWRGAIAHQRCLIPAKGFYEWKSVPTKAKQPYYITPKSHELFAFAGLFSIWKDVENHPLYTFSILTTQPNAEMAPIHDRMPVILMPEQESAWLNPLYREQEQLAPFLEPYKDGLLEVYPVSTEVNSAYNNTKELLQPLVSS
jgi:putative SOS response-associated peptidase YedK